MSSPGDWWGVLGGDSPSAQSSTPRGFVGGVRWGAAIPCFSSFLSPRPQARRRLAALRLGASPPFAAGGRGASSPGAEEEEEEDDDDDEAEGERGGKERSEGREVGEDWAWTRRKTRRAGGDWKLRMWTTCLLLGCGR